MGFWAEVRDGPEQCCSAVLHRETTDTSVDIDSFSVAGTYDDGSVDSVEGVSNPGEILGELDMAFTVDRGCGGDRSRPVSRHIPERA